MVYVGEGENKGENKMKKTLIFILTIVLLINTFLVSVSASTESGITPRWTNCVQCTTSFGVSNDTAEVFVDYDARDDRFTYAVLEVTVQKRFLLAFWRDVDVWTVTSYEHSDYYFVDIPVDGEGMYRAKFYLEFYGNTGDVDVVEDTIKFDYEG